MILENHTKIKEILPIIDDLVNVYQKNRAMLGAAFGNMELGQISEIINMVRGFLK